MFNHNSRGTFAPQRAISHNQGFGQCQDRLTFLADENSATHLRCLFNRDTACWQDGEIAELPINTGLIKLRVIRPVFFREQIFGSQASRKDRREPIF